MITQAKSFDSRTIEENEVRTSEAAASSTTEISRRQSSSRVMPFNMELPVRRVICAVSMTFFHFTVSAVDEAAAVVRASRP